MPTISREIISETSGASPRTHTHGLTINTGDSLCVVFFTGLTDWTGISITDSASNTWTQQHAAFGVEIWLSPDISSVPTTVSVNFTGTDAAWWGCFFSVDDALAATPLGQTGSIQTSSATETASVTTARDNEIVFGMAWKTEQNPVGVGTGVTAILAGINTTTAFSSADLGAQGSKTIGVSRDASVFGTKGMAFATFGLAAAASNNKRPLAGYGGLAGPNGGLVHVG